MKFLPTAQTTWRIALQNAISHQFLALPVPDGLLQLVQLVDRLLPADPARPAVEDVARLALRRRPRPLHQLAQLVLERPQHGGHLLYA